MLQLTEDLSAMCKEETGKDEEGESGLFDPPLYKQRYYAVAKVINQHKACSVVDMGCSEGQFLRKVKDLCPSVTEINGVDVDKNVLERNKFHLKPLTAEFIQRRPSPLKISMFCGSIASPDLTFKGVDVITGIEVIEHLYEEVLQLVPESLFGILQPKVVVLTTPNSEYNVLFENFSGMRHWDHKFEWTQKEFQSWCENITRQYHYDVEFSGVGDPPAGSNVGFCSQMAVFTQKYNVETKRRSTEKVDDGVSRNKVLHVKHMKYELIKEVCYPYDDINENRTEKVLNELKYIINQYYSDIPDDVSNCYTQSVPIKHLLSYQSLLKFKCGQEDILYLIKTEPEKFSLSADGEVLMVVLNTVSSDDESSLTDFNEEAEDVIGYQYTSNVTEENWD